MSRATSYPKTITAALALVLVAASVGCQRDRAQINALHAEYRQLEDQWFLMRYELQKTQAENERLRGELADRGGVERNSVTKMPTPPGMPSLPISGESKITVELDESTIDMGEQIGGGSFGVVMPGEESPNANAGQGGGLQGLEWSDQPSMPPTNDPGYPDGQVQPGPVEGAAPTDASGVEQFLGPPPTHATDAAPRPLAPDSSVQPVSHESPSDADPAGWQPNPSMPDHRALPVEASEVKAPQPIEAAAKVQDPFQPATESPNPPAPSNVLQIPEWSPEPETR